MATGTKAYIEDKDGNNILPATDWSIVQNKPTNLATTNQLPILGEVRRDGINFVNGAYDWDHVNNGYNCAYRIADMGSFKIIELRMMFACSHDITDDTELIQLPDIVKPDEDIQTWWPTNWGNIYIFLDQNKISVYKGGNDNLNTKLPANSMLSFHIMYMSAL